MRERNPKGATLSLVAVTILVIVVIGVCAFFLIKIMGGARELQNAVDAGNLNVAKTSLRSPDVKIFAQSGPLDLSGQYLTVAQQNFSQDIDPAVGEIDLLTFNKTVGQAMLVAMNAASDNYGVGAPSPTGIQNAKTLLDTIYNANGGLGTVLANKLKIDSAVDNNFLSVANLFPMRMLQDGSSAATISVDKDISFMVRGTGTNLSIATLSSEIPSEFNQIAPNFLGDNQYIASNGSAYIAGYQPINIPGITDGADGSYPLMGVAMRPGNKAHLVTDGTFQSQETSPLNAGANSQPGQSRIPPNGFKSAGWANESKSAQALQTLSCSIIGTVGSTGEYPPSIPCGYVVIANGADVSCGQQGVCQLPLASGINANAFGGSAGDVFGDLLMGGNIWVDPVSGAIATDKVAITQIQDWKSAQAHQGLPTTPVPSNLISPALKGPGNLQELADAIQPGPPPVNCDNKNSSKMGPDPNPTCVNAVSSVASVFNTNMPPTDPNQGGQIQGLMALEAEKAAVIDPRPAAIQAIGIGNGVCTGIKSYPWTGISNSAPIQFGTNNANLYQLLTNFQTYGSRPTDATTVYNQLLTKLHQIAPNSPQLASASQIQQLLSSWTLPIGSVNYIWADNSGNFHIATSAGVPSWINPANVSADGTTLSVTAPTGIDGVFVNLWDEEGFPHPWDCTPPTPSASNNMFWTRSSGFNCLQGILRFENCVQDGTGSWTCPC